MGTKVDTITIGGIKIPKLTHMNYYTWKDDAESVLYQRREWMYVETVQATDAKKEKRFKYKNAYHTLRLIISKEV